MTDSSILGALNAVQQDVLQALVAGQSISACIHRFTDHNWIRQNQSIARALPEARHHPAERILDELGDLAIDTFRQLLSDETAPASVRRKAAMEIAKLVEAQRTTLRETASTPISRLRQVANAPKPAAITPPVGRNAPCPCGNPVTPARAA